MRNFAILLVALTACTSARHIRSAQDEFSKAAVAENAVFGTGLPPDTRSAYRMSLSLVDRELKENEAKLRAEKLLGTALTLKAMCEWRLADLEKTDGTALRATLNRIRAEGDGITLGERDRVMAAALGGLHDHDRGRRANDWATAKGLFSDSFDSVGESIKSAPKRHPIRLYIMFAQLSICRSWQAAAGGFHRDDLNTADEEAKVPVDKAKVLLDEIKELEPNNAAARAQALKFTRIFGISDFSWPSNVG